DLLNLGNRFTMMVTNLPGAGLDPVRRLKAVHGAVLRTKSSGQRSVAPVLFDAAELVPPWLLRRAGPGLIRHQPFVNLAVTNMPGSATPLYLLGAPMTELYPFITVTGNIGVIVGVLSYVDTLGLSVTVDADVVPDLDRLVAALRAAADSLVDANHAAARASGQP
ncbi:MAG TPA: WS/DGAT domain-containing protein, partial [Acidimicrobiales bacterium]|nr:WS/DGAT domain-containing protein [Acidimicrobiales bacterium]